MFVCFNKVTNPSNQNRPERHEGLERASDLSHSSLLLQLKAAATLAAAAAAVPTAAAAAAAATDADLALPLRLLSIFNYILSRVIIVILGQAKDTELASNDSIPCHRLCSPSVDMRHGSVT